MDEVLEIALISEDRRQDRPSQRDAIGDESTPHAAH